MGSELKQLKCSEILFPCGVQLLLMQKITVVFGVPMEICDGKPVDGGMQFILRRFQTRGATLVR
ncbi:MAG: hypothetical protein COW19_05440 [Zetaproteobacteria bacterium CG12_big_fil_rev_8_21_14_0_65_55_1124]|nr:MAG: hypothetical protein AUJ58_00780 [Zetaproteobacteria bacterium CG1_02_55_237]PIW42974.1 MAG: hypothetical protein COW19_05440 [Zetaproteobacteria bacterium CG12_big_fil_rev_8_21_14_0_65_55_1124]PIY54277.1 MAG: hypothetical protein COZ01_00975 [Zetaproteobacteria bacterium CG_4_10_14_0_8_um_filter_55_43]PJB82872.1 MAG: hypothetical protein CO089_00220 [Zetaproteobacteria bacterium CG_4_9_14_0_8_um_filter_55_31]